MTRLDSDHMCAGNHFYLRKLQIWNDNVLPLKYFSLPWCLFYGENKISLLKLFMYIQIFWNRIIRFLIFLKSLWSFILYIWIWICVSFLESKRNAIFGNCTLTMPHICCLLVIYHLFFLTTFWRVWITIIQLIFYL